MKALFHYTPLLPSIKSLDPKNCSKNVAHRYKVSKLAEKEKKGSRNAKKMGRDKTKGKSRDFCVTRFCILRMPEL